MFVNYQTVHKLLLSPYYVETALLGSLMIQGSVRHLLCWLSFVFPSRFILTLLHLALCSWRLYGIYHGAPLPSGFQLDLTNGETRQQIKGREKNEEETFPVDSPF